MLKNILKLEGAQKLSKNEQKSINGGTAVYTEFCICNGRIISNGQVTMAKCWILQTGLNCKMASDIPQT
jgi:hypothetical protein